MNNYKKRMDKYRLPKERYRELREYCKHGATDEIREALAKTGGGTLAEWIERHVCHGGWKWTRMEAHGIPCNADTFRVYRAKFYKNLDDVLKRAEKGN